MGARPHPLDPATPAELELAVSLIRELYKDTATVLHFKTAGLDEPSKSVLLPFLQAERAGNATPPPNRCIFMMYFIKQTPRLFEAIVDVTDSKVIHHIEMPRGYNTPGDRIELNEAAAVALADPGVQKELERLQLGETAVVLDPWDYGRDDADEERRLTQIFFYCRNPKNNSPDSNHYAFPLDFMVIVDLILMKVVRIDHLPLGAAPLSTRHIGPHKFGKPIEPEYDHALQSFPSRTTLKPLQVIQPEGASFKVAGYCIEWEKWRFRVGFNWREGMTIHDVTFDCRETFYRLSLSEMMVPYGDGRAELNGHGGLHRKNAFDLGSVGAGNCSNDLALGCDCLGVIKYFDGAVINALGEAVPKKNAICVHEIDAGIQAKHTNHRTGKATVIRKRQLVLQTIMTIANYEYIHSFTLDQAGEIEYEMRATGILSTTPIDPDNTEDIAFGTRVASGVFAPAHQHIFNLRIDPAVDGQTNTLKVIDTVPTPSHPVLNPYGVAYLTEERTVENSGFERTDPTKGRVFKIVNPTKINPVSLTPVGYKIVTVHSQMLLAQPESWHSKRGGAFVREPLWVTKYRDRELFPAGMYTNQSKCEVNGLQEWADRKDPIDGEDIVIWHTFSFGHYPRCEDFPLMPVESAKVFLKPANFFTHNPAIDVPESKQAFNKSKLFDETLVVGADSGSATASSAEAARGCCKS